MIITLKILLALLAAVIVALPAYHGIRKVARGRGRAPVRQSPGTTAPAADEKNTAAGRIAELILPGGVFLVTLLFSGRIIVALLPAIAAVTAARSYAGAMKKKRTVAMEQQLLDAFQILAGSVNAGQSLFQALETAARGLRPPLAGELGETLRRIRLGTPIGEALVDLGRRTESKDLSIAVAALTLGKETGGSVGDILERIADTIRERQKIRGKITSLTAQGRASGIVMSSIPVLLLAVLFLLEPGLVSLLFTTTPGNMMLLTASLMIAAGYFFIRRIINIDL